MNKEYILYFIFLFIISVFNQCHSKYMNRTVEMFNDINVKNINSIKLEISEILEKLESYVDKIVNFTNFNNSKFLNENYDELNDDELNDDEPIVEEFMNYSIEGCNRDYESSWKEEFKSFTSREQIINYVFMLNSLYDKNISKLIELKESIIDDIYLMKKIINNSTDTEFVNCDQISPKQTQIIEKYCVDDDEDVFTNQKIVFTTDINTISDNICALVVGYNDLHHIVKEIIDVNTFLNSIWKDENEINKTNIQFKTDYDSSTASSSA